MQVRAKNLDIKRLINGNTELTFEVEDKSGNIAKNLTNQSKLLNSELELNIDKYSPKRSLNHNRLFWDMCNELSNHINDPVITANEIYKSLIVEYGVSIIEPIADDILEFAIKAWESRGEGWLTQVLRKSNLDGNFTNVKFWFGSSIYNSKMFWKLVEGLKILCKENDFDISHYDQRLQASIKALEEQEISSMQNKEKAPKKE